MTPDLLQPEGSFVLSQFCSSGTSDADTAHLQVDRFPRRLGRSPIEVRVRLPSRAALVFPCTLVMR
jgi:hypothetical protein